VDGKLKDVTFVESDGYPSKATGLAVTEFRPSPFTQMRQRYHRVTLYTRNLSKVSDEVVRSAIAHELGHVVSSHLQRLVNEERAEEIADILAMSWGFAKEWEAWNAANL